MPGGRRRRGRKSRVLDTYVTLWTNVTVIKIPVMAFHGLVHTLIPDGGMAAARYLPHQILKSEEKHCQ